MVRFYPLLEVNVVAAAKSLPVKALTHFAVIEKFRHRACAVKKVKSEQNLDGGQVDASATDRNSQIGLIGAWKQKGLLILVVA